MPATAAAEPSGSAAPRRTLLVIGGAGGKGVRASVLGRFVRLGSELERDKPGTGLGLYIVGTLVRRLRGKIKVRDRVPAPGTAFEVLLPGRAAAASDAM